MNAKEYIANLKSGVTLLEAANAGTSEGARKGWEERLSGIHAKLHSLHQELRGIEWEPKHNNDFKTGEHYAALDAHLDNAVGRASTLLQHAKRVK